MENISGFSREDEQIALPPGFRFHPTDEELISHYLSPKVLDSSFCAKAIGEVDLNKNEWVICRVFQKTTGGKKMHISGLVRLSNYGDEFRPNSNMPPLLDLSAFDTPRVTCFSNSMEDQKPQDMMTGSFSSPLLDPSSSTKPFDFSSVYNQIAPNIQNMQYPDSLLMQDQNILRYMVENNGASMKQNSKAELSQDTGMSTDISSAVSNHEMGQGSYEDQDYNISSADLDCLWNY
ncbi:hypothetical protein RJ639_014106 [Escallonia herrerae]|uniref:NAC domain-containing protein n=1 Tax=Escallonia herrerae TaxID=1293975 RepID=A0AA89AM48_9ASTE|nr:hypothetical protein RJ639_014106 [Escallonia herrerae]